MRRIAARGLLATLEQEQLVAAVQAGTPPVEETPVAPLVDHSDTVETDLIQIADTEAAAAQVDEQTEAAVDVATALEGIRDCLKSAAGNGGLNKDGALAVNIGVDALCRLVGMRRQAMPSLESYGTVSSRVAATQLAMESVGETAKKIWVAIVEAIKKSITWLVERWQLFFGTAAKVKERAEAVIAEAKKISGEPRTKELDKGGLVKALHVGGKADTASIIAGAERIGDIGKSVYTGAEKRVEMMAAAVAAKDLSKVKQVQHELGTAQGSSGYHQAEANDGLSAPEGAMVFRSQEMPGGKVVVNATPKEVGDTAEALLQAFRASTSGIGELATKAPEEGKLAVMSAADIEKLAGIVAAYCGTIAAFQEGMKKVTEAKKKVLAEAEKFAKGEGLSEEEVKNGKVFAQLLASVGKLVDNPIAGFSSYSINTGKSLLDYCTASVHAYGEDKSLSAKAGAAIDAVKDKVGLGGKKEEKEEKKDGAAPAAA